MGISAINLALSDSDCWMTHPLPNAPHKFECPADGCSTNSHTKNQLKLDLYLTKINSWVLKDEPQ